jgi:hypothetical protein
MSTPDARLSAAERAALADLEAAAAAADPSLAARLRGSSSWHAGPLARAAQSKVHQGWVLVLGLRLWGVPLFLAGLVFMFLGLSVGLALSSFGAVLAAVGLRVLGEMLLRHRSG